MRRLLAGTRGLMLAAPYYSTPTTVELVAHFKWVEKSVGLPIMLYNFPARTGVDMNPEFLNGIRPAKNSVAGGRWNVPYRRWRHFALSRTVHPGAGTGGAARKPPRRPRTHLDHLGHRGACRRRPRSRPPRSAAAAPAMRTAAGDGAGQSERHGPHANTDQANGCASGRPPDRSATTARRSIYRARWRTTP